MKKVSYFQYCCQCVQQANARDTDFLLGYDTAAKPPWERQRGKAKKCFLTKKGLNPFTLKQGGCLSVCIRQAEMKSLISKEKKKSPAQ